MTICSDIAFQRVVDGAIVASLTDALVLPDLPAGIDLTLLYTCVRPSLRRPKPVIGSLR